MPIAALVIGDSVLGAEVRRARSTSRGCRRRPRGRSCSVGGSAARSSRSSRSRRRPRSRRSSPARPRAPVAAFVAAAVGSAAYVAVFIAIASLTRRTAVWSLAFVFLVERLLGAALTGVAQLSPTWESRAIFLGSSTTCRAASCAHGIPQGGAAIVRLGIVTIVALLVAIWRMNHMRLAGASD